MQPARTKTSILLRTTLLALVLLAAAVLMPAAAGAAATDYATGTVDKADSFPPKVGDGAGVNARWKTVELRRNNHRYFLGYMQRFTGHNSVTTLAHPKAPVGRIDWVDGDFSSVKNGSAFRVRIQPGSNGNGLFTVDFYRGPTVDPSQWVAAFTFENGLSRGSWPWAGTAPVYPNRLVFQRGTGVSSQTVSYWAGSSLPAGGGGPVPHFVNPPQPAWVDIPVGGSHTIEYSRDQPISEQNIFFSIITDNAKEKPVCVVNAKLYGNGEIGDAKAAGCPSNSRIEVQTYPDHVAVMLPPQISK